MKVLVACEESQVVTKAFRALGHEAYSCDLQECIGGHSEWHIQDDVREHLNDGWDLMIAHPPCTYLTIRAQYWNKKRNRDEEKQKAINFFLRLADMPFPYAIENPLGIMSTLYRKPDQIIHPYHFGDPYMKRTCLWLKDLPVLKYTNIVKADEAKWIGKNGRKIYWHDALSKSVDRAKIKSKTFPGIAQAMATQWSAYILNQQTKAA